jgi:hypothetical protein
MIRACEGPLHLFMAVPMTISAAVADFGGCSRLRPQEKAQTSVVNRQFIAGGKIYQRLSRESRAKKTKCV